MGSGASAGRLRGELTEFIGRRAELAQIRQVLGTARLVTLTGPGGIGKTRLALETASGARRAFRDGVRLADLGALRDAGLLVPEVARSVGLSDQSPHWAVAALADYLAGRQLLLVLDLPPAELTFMAQRAGAHITDVKAGHLSLSSKARS